MGAGGSGSLASRPPSHPVCAQSPAQRTPACSSPHPGPAGAQTGCLAPGTQRVLHKYLFGPPQPLPPPSRSSAPPACYSPGCAGPSLAGSPPPPPSPLPVRDPQSLALPLHSDPISPKGWGSSACLSLWAGTPPLASAPETLLETPAPLPPGICIAMPPGQNWPVGPPQPLPPPGRGLSPTRPQQPPLPVSSRTCPGRSISSIHSTNPR